ncbi:MAG: beta strand repeat-containing protein, partial [Gemmataceae bacterium]
MSLNSESSIDTNNFGDGGEVLIQGFTQNAHNLILDTGIFATSFANNSTVDAEIMAITGGIELGTLGSTVTFGNNSTVTSRTDIIELNGANYSSPANNLASLIADDVKIDLAARMGGNGSYLLAPFTVNEKSYLGTAANTLLPGLKLTQAEFDTFSTDVNYVQIGRNTYSGTIQTGILNSANALYLVNNGGGGKVLVNGLLTVTGGDTNNLGLYVIGSGSTTVLSANIVTAGVDVLIDDAVQVDNPSIRIDTTAGGAVPTGAAVTLTGGSRGIFSTAGINNNLTVDGGTDGIVEFGYLRGFGNGATGSLLDSLTVQGHGITLYNDNTVVGNLTLNSSYVTLFGNNETYLGSIEIAGEVSLRNDVNLNAGSSIRLDSNLNGSGKNLSLGAVNAITSKGTIQGVNTLTLTNTGTLSTFQAVSAQNLNIMGSSASSSQVDFLGDMTVPGYVSTASGAYVVRLLGANNTIGGPLTTANDSLVIGNDDTDQTIITNDFNRALGTSLQGTIQVGGAVSLDRVSPTTPGANLDVYGQTIDIGFDTGIGSEFQSVYLSAVGDVNLNDGMLMVTDGLSIVGGSISQTFYSATKVGGLTYLYAYGDINLTAANDISLLEVYGNNVTLYTQKGVEFDGALISGNLNLDTDNLKGATGNINQTALKGVQVYGNANFYSLGDIALSNPLNVFTGNVTFSGVSVFLGGKSDINLGGGIASGDLTVNTSFANGDITQSGALSVTGLTTLKAGTGSVVLTNSLNSFGTGPVSVTAAEAKLSATGALNLGASTITNSMDVFATGPVTQSGALTIGNWLDVRSYADVTLTDAGNTVGTLGLEADSASFTEAGALTLGRVNVQQGDLTLTVGGDLIQTGPVQVVSPGATTTINAAGFDVILPDLRNDLVRAVINANNLVLADQNNVTLENSNLAGNLEVSADATVTLLGVISTGDATINAGQDIFGGSSTFGSGTANIHSFDAGRYIDFSNLGAPSRFNGSTYFNGTIVDVTATGDLVLAAGNASILMRLVTDGSISQDKSQGYLNLSGNMILEAKGNITLDAPGNVLVGTIASSATNITLLNTSQILLDTTTATGDLTLIAPAGVDQINPVTVGGKLDIQAASDSVNLTNAKNSLPTITLVADSANIVTQGAVNLLPITAGTFSLKAGGAVSQQGALTADVADISAFSPTSGPASITLDDATNRLRELSVMGGTVVVNDTGYLDLGLVHANSLKIAIPGDLYQSNLLSVNGPLTITAQDVSLPNPDNTITGAITLNANSARIVNSADINLANVAVTEGLALETPGSISQTGSIKAGTYDLFASEGASLNNLGGGTGANQWEGGLLSLTGVNNLWGGLTSHGTQVQVEGEVFGQIRILSG